RAASRSNPTTSIPAFVRPRPIDPPTRPVPTSATLRRSPTSVLLPAAGLPTGGAAEILTQPRGSVQEHVVDLAARAVAVAVDHDAHAPWRAVGYGLLLGAEEGDVAEVEGLARGGRRELRGEVGCGGEDDAHDVVVGELVAGEHLLHEAR